MSEIIVTTKKDLQEMINEGVLNAMRSMMPAFQPADDNPAGTRREVAEYLKISLSKLDQMAVTGELKPFNLGGRSVRYKWSDVKQYLNNK